MTFRRSDGLQILTLLSPKKNDDENFSFNPMMMMMMMTNTGRVFFWEKFFSFPNQIKIAPEMSESLIV